jgi:signal transduction histidine kinase/CheY-like chemotaxis protein
MAIGVGVIIANAGAAAYDAWRTYHDSLGDTDRELLNTARILAAHAAGTLQTVDVLLRDTAEWYGRERSTAAPTINSELTARAEALPWLLRISIADPEGIQQYRSKAVSNPKTDVSEHSYFSAHRDDPRVGLFVSEPVITEIEGRPTIALSRRLSDVDGGFAGVVTGYVPMEHLRDFYRQINLGPHSAILLLREDGTLLAGEPDVSGALGESFPSLVALVGSDATARMRSPIDGVRRFTAGAPVEGFPLIVDVAREEASVLAPLREEAMRVFVRTLVLSLLGALAIAALVLQLRKVEQREQALRKAQKMEAVGTLAGGIAHDFNNILGAILGYGEMAQKAASDGSDQRRYVDNVMHAGARAKALVERILAFSRSGMGERAPVNVQALVEETLELLAASLRPGVRLERTLDAGDVAVIGDATQLHQVVMNLCTNAVQAMPDGGVLEVRLNRTTVPAPQTLSHGELIAGPYVRLVVQDSGSGIEADVLDRMFDPFFTTKGVGEGTGLGLSLVHGIVADLGGAIDVTSAPGHGATFTIWMPALAATPLVGPEHADELPRGSGEVVMVIDDEPALVALAEEMLAELGYEPVGFTSSKTALDAFFADTQRFDLVLTDEMMPGITGTGLALGIKQRRSDIPIVIMTGYTDSAVEALARSADVTEILRKPLQMRDIAQSFARILRTRRSKV